MRRILSILVDLLVAVALVAAASAALFAFSGPHDRSSAFLLGYKPLVVLSGSMEPTLKTDSIVVVRRVPFSTVVAGDVVSVSRGDGFITHRVVEVLPEGFVTKGDANRTTDPGLVRADESVARVEAVLAWPAPFVHALRTGEGFVELVVVPSVALLSVGAAAFLLLPSSRPRPSR